MKHNILHFPNLFTQPSEKNEIGSTKANNVIVVDFIAAKELAKQEAELVRLRHAFDLARADWPLEKAEFLEKNKRFFHN